MTRWIGLGAMRLSTLADRDTDRGIEVLGAALAAGANLIDTAPTYGLGEGDEHHNERLVAQALASFERRSEVKVVTKCGLRREGQAFVPDGRAKSIVRGCEASLTALGGEAIDLLLLHAVDPRTPIETSVRAMEDLRQRGLVKAIGLSNVNGSELDRAREVSSIEALELELGAFSEQGWKSGLAARALKEGMLVLLHSPLGGPKRAPRLARDPVLREIAERKGFTAAEITLAYHRGLHENVIPLPGACRVVTAAGAARAATLDLDESDRSRLDERFSAAARALGRTAARPRPREDREVVLVMGIQGAGKSTHVRRLEAEGFCRLNRDEQGGTLKRLAQELDGRLGAGGRRFVLDNTYATRALRADVIEVSERHGAQVRCIHLVTPLEIAQRQVVERLVDRYGRLPPPEELKTLQKTDPQALLPNALFRYQRELEPPALDEGFEAIERVEHSPKTDATMGQPALIVAEEALRTEGLEAAIAGEPFGPVLVFAWRGERARETVDDAMSAASVDRRLGSRVETAVCPHPGGPPSCWCRPPLPGIAVPWMQREQIAPASTRLVGLSPTHRALARSLGVRFVDLTAYR